MKRTKLDDRVLPVYTKGEEIFNMVTHIVGGAMGIAALVLCIIFCHDGYGLFSGIVYGISMILLYTMSARQTSVLKSYCVHTDKRENPDLIPHWGKQK